MRRISRLCEERSGEALSNQLNTGKSRLLRYSRNDGLETYSEFP